MAVSRPTPRRRSSGAGCARAGKTICPSDAARALGGADGFRPLMPPLRAAARALEAEGRLDVTQRGELVDLDTARGAIRLRLPPE